MKILLIATAFGLLVVAHHKGRHRAHDDDNDNDNDDDNDGDNDNDEDEQQEGQQGVFNWFSN